MYSNLYAEISGDITFDQETIDFWEARDACFCTALYSPVKTVDGVHHYQCTRSDCGVSWTRKV